MLWLALGALTLFAFLGGLRAFERASVTTIRSFFAWLLALGGLALALLLVLTGREGIALGAVTLLGPLLWNYWKGAHPAPGPSPGSGPRPGTGGAAPPPARAGR